MRRLFDLSAEQDLEEPRVPLSDFFEQLDEPSVFGRTRSRPASLSFIRAISRRTDGVPRRRLVDEPCPALPASVPASPEDKAVAAEGISAGVIVGVVVAATLFTLIACVMCLKFRRKKSAVAARVKRANALLQEKAKDMRARDSVSTEFSTISAAEAAYKRNTQLVAGPTADALAPPDGGDKA